MSASGLELSIKITADQADAVKGLLDLGEKVEATGKKLDDAREESNRLKAAWDDAGGAVDHLALQIATGRKALEELGTRVGKNHVEYKALQGEIADLEAAFKRQLPEVNSLEKAYAQAAAQSNKLESQLSQQQAQLDQGKTALRDSGINVENLAGEYQRLSREVQQATTQRQAYNTLGIKPLQDEESQIRAIRDAYDTLKNSGTLTEKQLADLAQTTAAKIDALGGDVRGLSEDYDKLKAAQQQALDLKTLNLKPLKDTQAEVQAVREAFDRLKASGTLSEQELAQAALNAAQKINALGGDVRGLSTEFDRLQAEAQRALDIETRAKQAADAMRMYRTTSEPVVTTFANLGTASRSASAGLADVGSSARQAGRAMADAGEQGSTGLGKLKPLVAAIRQELAGLAVGYELAAFIKSTVNAARQAEMAFKGLEGVARNSGLEIGTLFNAAGKQAADGLITLTESSRALQNLLLSGFGIDQAVALMGRLKDAASLNRSAQMSLGEAVVSVTEGFRTESSELLNNGGIVTNLSAMYEAYAKTLGKSADSLTQAEKAQALFNGVMKDTDAYVGNAEKSAGGLEGALSSLRANLTELQTAFGGDLGPAVQFVAGLLNGLIDIAKHVGVGMNVAGLETAAFAKSIGDVYDAVASGNLDGLADKIKANFAMAHEMAIEVVDRYERGITPAIQQATDKTTALGTAGQKAGTAVSAGQQQAQTALDNTGKAADSVEKKLAKVFEDFKPTASIEDLSAFIAKVNEAGGKGADAGEKIEAAWNKAIASLSSGDLTSFVQSLDVRLTQLKLVFQGNTEEAQQLSRMIDTGVRAAIDKLGLDANQALTGVSSKVKESLGNFEAMQRILVSTGAAGSQTGAILVEGLRKVAAEAKTAEDIDAIRKRAVELGVDGKQAGDIVVHALQRIAGEAKTAEDIDRIRKMAVALGTDGSASIQQLVAVYDALKKAAENVGTAEAKHAAALADSRAEISKSAAALTEAEKAHGQGAQAAARHAGAQRDLANATEHAENAANREGVALQRVYDPAEVATNTIKQLSQALWEQTLLFGRGIDNVYSYSESYNYIRIALDRITEQKSKVDELTRSIQEATRTGIGLADAARESTLGFGELNQEHLEGLQAAIDAARAKLESLTEAAANARRSVMDELDQLDGNLAAIEERNYESRKAQLQAALAEAQQAGASEAAASYQEALMALEELHAKKMANIRKTSGAKEQGGPVEAGKEYMVGEDGEETYVDDQGNAYVIGTKGPGLWRAPRDGTIYPNGAQPAGQSTAPTPTAITQPQPQTAPTPVQIVRHVIERPQQPPITVDTTPDTADAMTRLVRELTLGAYTS